MGIDRRTYTPDELAERDAPLHYDRPNGEPKPGCQSCPMIRACPLKAYVQPCRWRVLYSRWEFMRGDA